MSKKLFFFDRQTPLVFWEYVSYNDQMKVDKVLDNELKEVGLIKEPAEPHYCVPLSIKSEDLV